MKQADRLDSLLDRFSVALGQMEDTLRSLTEGGTSVQATSSAPAFSQKDAKEAKEAADKYIERRTHEIRAATEELRHIVEAQIE